MQANTENPELNTQPQPIDQIIHLINGFGRYQKILISILFLMITSHTFFIVNNIYMYLMPHVQQVCLDENFTMPENSNLEYCSVDQSIFYKNHTKDLNQFTYDYWGKDNLIVIPENYNQTLFEFFDIQKCDADHPSASCLANPCTHHPNSVYKGCLDPALNCTNRINIYALKNGLDTRAKNAIIEFDFVCENQYKRDYCFYSGFIGILVGSITYGVLSDTLGRKITFLFGTCLMYLAGICMALLASENFLVLLFCAFFVGMGANIALYNSIILISEFVDAEHRSLAQLASVAGKVLGTLIAPWSTKLIPTWREHNLVFWSSFLCIIPPISMYFMVETPYWLLTKQKFKELEKCCQAIYQINHNGRKMSSQVQALFYQAIAQHKQENLVKIRKRSEGNSISSEDYNYKYYQAWQMKFADYRSHFQLIFANFTHMKNLILLILYWGCLNFTNYCLGINISNLPGSIYINSTITAGFQFIAYPLTWTFLEYLSRKTCLIVWPLISVIFYLMLIFLPDTYESAKLTLYHLTSMSHTGTYRVLFIVGVELFPTTIRGTCNSLVSGFARFGLAFSPFWVFYTSEDGYQDLFYTVIMMGSVISVILVFFFPSWSKNIQ